MARSRTLRSLAALSLFAVVGACSASTATPTPSQTAAPPPTPTTAASPSGSPAASQALTSKPAKKIGLLIPGTSGDSGFFDQSIAGVKQGAQETGVAYQIVEAGYDPTKWEPALTEMANGDFDTIITGSFAMQQLVEQAANKHPDKQFILFDIAADLTACKCTNIYSMTYRYLETGYLAGTVAGLIEADPSVPRNNGKNVVGVVGGLDIPVIEDYINGYKQGVAAVNPNVKVLSAFANSFSDPVKGKAVGGDMVSQGADILFSAAGATDKGVFEAAAAGNGWGIGNSFQQAQNPTVNGVAAILTSSDTNVQTSLYDAVKRAVAGTLPLGSVVSFGVAEGTNSIIKSDTYVQNVPQSIRDQVDAITSQIKAGTLKVGS